MKLGVCLDEDTSPAITFLALRTAYVKMQHKNEVSSQIHIVYLLCNIGRFYWWAAIETLLEPCPAHSAIDRFQVVGGNGVFSCPPMPTSNWLCMCCHGRQPYLKGVHNKLVYSFLVGLIKKLLKRMTNTKMSAFHCEHSFLHSICAWPMLSCFSLKKDSFEYLKMSLQT